MNLFSNDPDERRFVNQKGEIHVQFYDSIMSRAWVLQSNVEEMIFPDSSFQTLLKAGKGKLTNELNQGIEDAFKTSSLNTEDRRAAMRAALTKLDQEHDISSDDDSVADGDFKVLFNK